MGLATVIHKEHNDYADKLADSGVELHTACMVALSSIYARRVTLMECVVCHIHRHITSTLQAHNQARERKRKPAYLLTHPQVKSTITVPLTLAVIHHDTGHTLSPHDPKLLGHDDPNHPAMQVWSFLSLFKFRRTDEHEQGTTWIELFILIELMEGGHKLRCVWSPK